MTLAKPTEAEVAAVVVAHLTARGYDVYSEVELRPQGIRADIVARGGPELTIVETKTSGSLALLYQAMERRRFAHRVYVAVPVPAGAMIEVCKELGIGVLRVRIGPECEQRWSPDRVDEELVSRRWNTRSLGLTGRLKPEHKTACAAGSPTGGHWSRWRDTCAQLARVVQATPGLSVKEAIAATPHHYSSARCAASTMAAHVREGRVPGVRIERGALWPVAGDP